MGSQIGKILVDLSLPAEILTREAWLMYIKNERNCRRPNMRDCSNAGPGHRTRCLVVARCASPGRVGHQLSSEPGSILQYTRIQTNTSPYSSARESICLRKPCHVPSLRPSHTHATSHPRRPSRCPKGPRSFLCQPGIRDSSSLCGHEPGPKLAFHH